MRFGESFPQGADPKNRMAVLRMSHESEGIPSYIKFGLKIRDQLKAKVDKDGWPDLPQPEQINGMEDIFEVAKNEVDQTWELSVRQLINDQAETWKKDLDVNDPETKDAFDLLNNPEEFQKSFSLRQFGVLESLRTVNPEAWRTLVIASSERQLASIATLEHWLKYSDEESLNKLCQKIGLSVEELKLFVDTAAILGKYIDHAYVKQIELADLPGGSQESKLGEEEGAQYVYDLYKDPRSEDVDIKTYSEIFPFEWDKIKSRLDLLSVRTKLAVDQEKLPPSYALYSEYLKKMSEVYSSDSIKPEELEKMWDDLYKMGKELDSTDCPIMLIPQGCASVSGEAGKVDAELRLGLKTEETKKREKDFGKFTEIGQRILDSHRDSLDKDYQVPNVNLNYQPWSFGSNLYWVTRGESSESQILSHTNAVVEVAVTKEIPLLKKIFDKDIDSLKYSQAAVTETVLHETAHNVIDSEDKKIAKRIGKSFEAGILEELKAEVVGTKILYEAHKRGEVPDWIDLKTQILAKLGANLDYLKNKSDKKAGAGEAYYLCGATILSRLFDKGLIKKMGAAYEITDEEACLKEMAELGDEVLSFYTNSDSKPADVKAYIKELRSQGQSPLIKGLIREL